MSANRIETERPRFTLQLTLRDNRGLEQPLAMAVGCDEALRISTRAVGEMKAGFIRFDDAIELMRTREMRRDLFVMIAERLANQMADRMEDAEGWHGTNRIEPARKQLGGRW